MQRFQHIVIAAGLMVLLVRSTSLAGPYCGSDANNVFYKLYNYTTVDSDWWPSADIVDFVSIVYDGGLSFLHYAQGACVLFGIAYWGEGCRVHDECYDGLAYPGASRQQCDQVLKDMWIDACNREYSEVPWWNPLNPVESLCREYCQFTAEISFDFVRVFGGSAWNKAAPDRVANAATVHSREAFSIRKQCLELTPPGGTCVIPPGDYREVLTITRSVRLESAGGLVRIRSN